MKLVLNHPCFFPGAFYSLAVIAEGCSENIKRKYLMDFLKCIDAGIQHPTPAVRNSALYALGQFSDYLQVGTNKFTKKIWVPWLLSGLGRYSTLHSTEVCGLNLAAGVSKFFNLIFLFTVFFSFISLSHRDPSVWERKKMNGKLFPNPSWAVVISRSWSLASYQ